MKRDGKDYEVGYRKPPKEHQFKPGQSGNPAGRPKRKQLYSSILEEELSRLIPAIEDGRKSNVSMFRGKVRQALQNNDHVMLKCLHQMALCLDKINSSLEEAPNYSEALRAKIEAMAKRFEERMNEGS